jgi:hypothetical protein
MAGHRIARSVSNIAKGDADAEALDDRLHRSRHPVAVTEVGLTLKVEHIQVARQRGKHLGKALKDHSEAFPVSQTAFQRIVTAMAGLEARNATLPRLWISTRLI